MKRKRVLVQGAAGFIGGHLVRRLVADGLWVRGVDRVEPAFRATAADEFVLGDLRDPDVVRASMRGIDAVYQLAAEMGGAGYLFTGAHDARVMHDSALINLHTLGYGLDLGIRRFFFSSSACVYPEHDQADPDAAPCVESSAYPAAPDSEYGWEKLYAERLFRAYARNHGIEVRIARYHNVFGPDGAWCGGREKAPAALCRKVAEAEDGGAIEIWGDGEQTRSFLYIDECVEGTRRLMDSDVREPLNIGSAQRVSINDLARTIAKIAGKDLRLRHVEGPTGVRGRVSDNARIHAALGWKPEQPLRAGLEATYRWIESQVQERARAASTP